MPDVLVVDRQGLARKIAKRPKAFILYELLQNAWDENVTWAKATAKMLPGRPACHITVEDDSPEGFADMRSIYTMFRDSKKASDPSKRGRFELGEKMVLALAQEATIITTKGTVVIQGNERKHSAKKRDAGTLVDVTVKMTREEYDQMVRDVFKIMPAVPTWFNGEAIPARKLLDRFEVALPTICADEDGQLFSTSRKTDVVVVERHGDEPAMLYEMGLPVVETGDKWHYDVMQRVPLNWERNNVRPSYLKTLRVFVLNMMHEKVTSEESAESWVRDAAADERCVHEAFSDIMKKRFGDKVVVRDPNDPESAANAMAAGYEVLGGRALSAGEWNNARQFGSIPSSSKLFATPKPYSDDPDADPVKVIEPDKYTDGMRQIVEYTKLVGSKLIKRQLSVEVVHTTNNFSAAFMRSSCELHFNVFRLGKRWFEEGITEEVDRLIIHELAHYYESNHLSDKYHEACCRLGARLKQLALDEPSLFKYS
jgi:hypothetical protein